MQYFSTDVIILLEECGHWKAVTDESAQRALRFAEGGYLRVCEHTCTHTYLQCTYTYTYMH